MPAHWLAFAVASVLAGSQIFIWLKLLLPLERGGFKGR